MAVHYIERFNATLGTSIAQADSLKVFPNLLLVIFAWQSFNPDIYQYLIRTLLNQAG